MRPHPVKQASFLFVHGWSGTASVWDEVRAALPDARTDVIEHGYLGATPRRRPVPDGTIVVGHSAGVPELLSDLPTGCAGLVSINGFTRFTAGPDHPSGVPVRLLDRMLLRLDEDPEGTVAAFRARCGIHAPIVGTLQPQRLRAGLLALRDTDARAALARSLAPMQPLAPMNPLASMKPLAPVQPLAPVRLPAPTQCLAPSQSPVPLRLLALAGRRDPIVPPALTGACFPASVITWHDEAGHLLPRTHPQWCAAHLRAFAA